MKSTKSLPASSNPLVRIAVLMTCYNRKEMTLRCLSRLNWPLDVYLVDDGCADGTSAAVRKYADEVVKRGGGGQWNLHLVHGNGSLFWARGMELAWREALRYEDSLHSAPAHYPYAYDGFLWLNDDVDLGPNAISAILHSCSANQHSVVVGELENARGEIVYGTRGDLFTGNFVFVPRSVYEKVGMICGEFAHAWADSDYAMRCKRAGVRVVSCGVVGRCEGHPNRPPLKGLSLRERWGMLFDPKGWCVHDLWLYRRRNWGVCAAIASCAHLVLHVLFGGSSRA